jgi:hypothetical protein
VHGRPLAYLDNAATTQKPHQVIEAVAHLYRRDNANVQRGVHALGERATAAYEATRERVRAFINARSAREIVFLRGTTEEEAADEAELGELEALAGVRQFSMRVKCATLSWHALRAALRDEATEQVSTE